MLLFSPPRCNDLHGSGLARHSTLTSIRFSIPAWLRSAPPGAPLSHPDPQPSRSSLSSKSRPQLRSSPAYMAYSSSPWSLHYSPTLGSIPEVFEYEPLVAARATGSEVHETPDVITPELSLIAKPKLSRTTSRRAIIQSPPRRITSALSVSKVLRKVLDADLMRRRRIMRIYLKAIIFLKYMWRVNERYGTVMLTTGMYMPR